MTNNTRNKLTTEKFINKAKQIHKYILEELMRVLKK